MRAISEEEKRNAIEAEFLEDKLHSLSKIILMIALESNFMKASDISRATRIKLSIVITVLKTCEFLQQDEKNPNIFRKC